jgi:CheY-like chemotaxis protein
MTDSVYILVAEDDEDDRYLLKTVFEEVAPGTQIIFVENGILLLKHFSDFEQGIITTLPTLMIVDINMPKKNGKEAVEELVGKSYFKKFPTVFFSTTSSASEEKKCYDLGVSGYYVKPSNYSSLLELAKKFVEMSSK